MTKTTSQKDDNKDSTSTTTTYLTAYNIISLCLVLGFFISLFVAYYKGKATGEHQQLLAIKEFAANKT